MEVKPIGIVHSPFREAAGTPIQPRAAECIAEAREKLFSSTTATKASSWEISISASCAFFVEAGFSPPS